MPINIDEFIQVYIDEEMEMLQGIERTILNLDLTAIDSDDIDYIFRSIHSLKGNSAVFGFTVIGSFTHTRWIHTS